MKITNRILVAVAVFSFCSTPAWAGYVTAGELTNLKTAMDLIYSQAGFGLNDIEIRFKAIQTIVGPTTLNSDADYTALEALSPDPSPTVDAFFVDAIPFCGEALENIVGCANRPGHELWLASGFVDTNQNGVGATDFAHELGHNLNLVHITGTNTNLMNPVLGSTVLTAAQITTILASALVQTDDAGQNYILITPIQVVPLPPAAALFLSGLMALGGCTTRRLRQGMAASAIG
mgnify:CR=1 FL=1